MLKLKYKLSVVVLLMATAYSSNLLSQTRCISLFASRPIGFTQVSSEKSGLERWLKTNYFRILETDFKTNSHSQKLLLIDDILHHSGFKVRQTFVTHVNDHTVSVTKDYQLKNPKNPNQNYLVRTKAQFFYSTDPSKNLLKSLNIQNADFVVFGIHDQSANLENILEAADELQSKFHFEVQASGYQRNSENSISWANYQRKVFYDLVLPLALQDPSIWELRLGKAFGFNRSEVKTKTAELPRIIVYRNLPRRLIISGSVAPVHLLPIEHGVSSNFAGVSVTSDWMTDQQTHSIWGALNRSQYVIVFDELSEQSPLGTAILIHRDTGRRTELRYNPNTGTFSLFP